MSLICCLCKADESQIDFLLSSPEKIFDFLENGSKGVDLDKAWHGIHFLLTGSAWIEACFPNAEDEYAAAAVVRHSKLAFMDVGNGDCLALELSNLSSEKAAVVYLSHNDGEGHGYILGNSFTDFMERRTQRSAASELKIGCCCLLRARRQSVWNRRASSLKSGVIGLDLVLIKGYL